jgi:hypothetical protein
MVKPEVYNLYIGYVRDSMQLVTVFLIEWKN